VKLLADECIERSIVNHLKENGFDIFTVAELTPGASDDIVIKLANKKKSILVTADKDFGELFYRQRKLTYGIILLRLHGLSSENKARVIVKTLNEHKDELLGSFTVIEPTQIRIRRAST